MNLKDLRDIERFIHGGIKMTESQKYSKKEFPFGRIAVAYSEINGAQHFNITYWGNDGIFEQVKYFGGNVSEQNAGNYGSNGINFGQVNECPNISAHQTEISDIIYACLAN